MRKLTSNIGLVLMGALKDKPVIMVSMKSAFEPEHHKLAQKIRAMAPGGYPPGKVMEAFVIASFLNDAFVEVDKNFNSDAWFKMCGVNGAR